MRTFSRVMAVFATASIMLTAGCGGGAVDEEAVTEAVTTVLEKQAEAWNKVDIESYMAGYYRSENLTFSSGGNVTRGWEPVLERYKTRYTPEMMGKLTFSNIEVTPLGPDAAYVLGAWSLEREPDNPGGIFTLVFRKFPDGWKIVHDHTSSKE